MVNGGKTNLDDLTNQPRTEKLLKLIGPVHIVGGLALFVSGFVPAMQDAMMNLLPTSETFVWSTFFVAVLGPTIASWGVLFGALVIQYYQSPSPTLWRAMLYAVLIWAPLDSALSLYYGLWGGVVINTIVFVVLLVLLIRARDLIK